MLEHSLRDVVKQWATITQGVADVDLDREWGWEAYTFEGVRFAFFRTYEELYELALQVEAERQEPVSMAQQILGQYHVAYCDLQAALLGVTDEMGEEKSNEEAWSVRQAVAHIVQADVGFLAAIQHGLDRYGEGLEPSKIPDEKWEAYTGSDQATFEGVMNGSLSMLCVYHQKLHERILRTFAGITKDGLHALSLFWEPTPMSVQFRLQRYASHCRQHTIQIDKTLVKLGYVPNEAKRLLRLLYAGLAEVERVLIGEERAGFDLRAEAAGKIGERAEEIAGILAK